MSVFPVAQITAQMRIEARTKVKKKKKVLRLYDNLKTNFIGNNILLMMKMRIYSHYYGPSRILPIYISMILTPHGVKWKEFDLGFKFLSMLNLEIDVDIKCR